MSAGQLIWPCGEAQLVPFRICRQGYRLCQLDSCSTSWWQAVLLGAAVSASARRLSITRQVPWRDVLRHRPSLLPPHPETKEDPHPQQKTRTQQNQQRDEGEAIRSVARVAQYNRPVTGLPCWPWFFLWVGGKINQPWVSHVGYFSHLRT